MVGGIKELRANSLSQLVALYSSCMAWWLAVSMDGQRGREGGREEDEEESCWVPCTTPIIRRTVLLTRERRPRGIMESYIGGGKWKGDD